MLMSEMLPDHADVIAPPPLIYAGALGIGLLLQRVKPISVLPPQVARVVGMCLIGINFLIGVPAVVIMRRAQTALNPTAPTTAIVTSGPFRYTRNPIYLSFTLLYMGIALVRNALWPLLLLPAVLVVMDRRVIAREERYLKGKFGAEYTQYTARVRRWL